MALLLDAAGQIPGAVQSPQYHLAMAERDSLRNADAAARQEVEQALTIRTLLPVNQGLGRSQALAEAKRHLAQVARFHAPFFWAGFVLYGEPR